jgi:hypothetical protein
MRKWLRDPVPEIPEIPEIPKQDPPGDPAQAISGICGIYGRGVRPEDDLVPEGSVPAARDKVPLAAAGLVGADVGTVSGSSAAEPTMSAADDITSSRSDDIIAPTSAGTDITDSACDITGSTSANISGSSDISGSRDTTGSTDSTALRQTTRPWGSEDWLIFYDEKAGIAEHDGGLCRQEAEKHALEHCISEWLYQHPMSSDAEDGCLACAETDKANDDLLPVGLGGGEVWLHRGCSAAWRAARIAEAVAGLAAMGIGGPTE